MAWEALGTHMRELQAKLPGGASVREVGALDRVVAFERGGS